MGNETTEVVILELKVTEGGSGSKAIPEVKKEVEALAGSILGLQNANKKYREERKLLDTTTAEGSKRIKELNADIDKNDKAIKANSSSLEKQRLNIGNYTGALDKLIPGLGATVNGFLGMTKASLAFIATPIGAVIAALALALGALMAYFKGSEEGADKFAKISAQASAVVGVLMDRVVQLGGAISAFLSGDFDKGLSEIKGAFSNVGDEILREVDAAGKLADAIDALEERERKYQLTASATANEIKKLIIESKNRTLSEQERISKLEEATNKEVALNKELLAIREQDIVNSFKQIEIDNTKFGLAQKAGESALEYAKRIALNDKLEGAARDKLIDLIKAYDQAQGDSFNLQEKIQNQSDLLRQKAIDAKAKQDAEDKKASDEARELRIKNLEDAQDKEHQIYLKKLQDQKTFEVNEVAGINRVAAVRKKQSDNDKKQAISELQSFQAITKAKIQLYGSLGNSLVLLAGKNKALALTGVLIEKAGAIAQIIADTGIANAKAVAASPLTFGMPWVAINTATGILAGVGVAAQAAKSISEISSASKFQNGGLYDPKFARGGKYFPVGGRLHSQGGTKYTGEDGNAFEVERGEGIYIMKRNAEAVAKGSLLNQSFGGNSWMGQSHAPHKYAFGGSFLPSQTSAGLTVNDIRNIIASTPPPIVLVEDINSAQTVNAGIINRAQVLGS